MTQFAVDIAFATPSELGEGALWDARQQRLYWVDILLQKVYAYDPKSRSNLAYDVGQSVGTVVLTDDDKLLLGLRNGFGWLEPATGETHLVSDPEADKPHTRFNDGKCDPQGRFWVGTICEREPTFDGGLYCLAHDLSVTKKLDKIQCGNGLVWSKDGTRFYYIDTPTQQIWGFDFAGTSGQISNKTVVATIPRGHGCPDGMTIDEADHLWVAMWDGGRVLRVDPATGQIECEIPMPARNVTSVAFGGADLDELYVTTARVGMSPEQRHEFPHAGSLFRVKLPYRGVPATRFAGKLD
jgi:sugar lactone lactonase YvrE